jgi:hypothetical protein
MLTLRERAAKGGELLPRLYVASPSLYPAFMLGDKVGGFVDSAFRGRYTFAAGRDTVVQFVEAAQAAGYDFLKMYNWGAEWDSAVVTARRIGFPIAGHMGMQSGMPDAIDRAIAAGYRSIEHLDGFASYLAGMTGNPPRPLRVWEDDMPMQKLRTMARKLRQADVWNCATAAIQLPMGGGDDSTAWLIPEAEYLQLVADIRRHLDL